MRWVDFYDTAMDQLERDPYQISWWLGEQTPVPGPVDVGRIADRLDAGLPCSPAELLALAFNDAQRAVRALHLLREAYRADPGICRDAEILSSHLEHA